MMHIPAHKNKQNPGGQVKTEQTLAGQQSDKTLADYIKRKMDTFYAVYPYESDKKVVPMTDVSATPPKKTFDEWMDEPYFELNNRTTSRRQWWTDSEIDAAKDAWASAREQ
jgi:hypothetical protein